MNRAVFQVAFFCAQSDPRSCGLSLAQERFLQRLRNATGVATVSRNFPYSSRTPAWRDLPLWRASWHVTRQYVAARRPEFAARHAPAVLHMLDQAEETLLLLGSCGLELLRRLDLPPEWRQRVSFIAFGAYARGGVPLPGLIVRGRRDWIARGPRPDHWIACGHLGYLEDEAFERICLNYLRERMSLAPVRHAAAL